MSSSAKPQLVDEAAKQLQHAFIAKRGYYLPLYESDTAFDRVRSRIDSYLVAQSRTDLREPRADRSKAPRWDGSINSGADSARSSPS